MCTWRAPKPTLNLCGLWLPRVRQPLRPGEELVSVLTKVAGFLFAGNSGVFTQLARGGGDNVSPAETELGCVDN